MFDQRHVINDGLVYPICEFTLTLPSPNVVQNQLGVVEGLLCRSLYTIEVHTFG